MEHLITIINSVGIDKYNPERFLPAGILVVPPLGGGNGSNPIVGVLRLDHDERLSNNKAVDSIMQEASGRGHFTIDILVSLNGLAHWMVNKEPPHSPRELLNPWIKNEQYFYQTVSENEQISRRGFCLKPLDISSHMCNIPPVV